jgi:homoserine O-acetyltransferase
MLDYFDLSREYNNDPVAAFANATCDFLVLSFSSDWRFAPERSREITDALMSAGKSVSYVEVESDKGHDAFLLPNDRYEKALAGYLSRVAEGLGASVGDEQ